MPRAVYIFRFHDAGHGPCDDSADADGAGRGAVNAVPLAEQELAGPGERAAGGAAGAGHRNGGERLEHGTGAPGDCTECTVEIVGDEAETTR